MLKVLFLGNCPLPEENTKSRPAAGLRTWQFLKPLLKQQKLKMTVVTIAMPECYEETPKMTESEIDGCKHYVIPKNQGGIGGYLQRIHNEVQPDVIIAINTFPSFLAAKIKSKAPMWADLNGWIMAEAQAQAHKLGFDEYIGHYLNIEKSILKRADRISTVSKNQKMAVLGELAILGRLGKDTFGEDIVFNVGNATENFKGDELKQPLSLKLEETAFVGLWVGGYNTWVDEVTLFRGVVGAMKKCERFHYVSTGGGIEGLDNKTFANFRRMVEESEFKARFHFLGWVDTAQMPTIYEQSHFGLNVDKDCIETVTGARNRINEMMKFGLPLLTTLGSEISYEAVTAGAGIGVVSGDSEALTEAIMRLYNEGGERYAKAGKEYVAKNSYDELIKPLLKWLNHPVRMKSESVLRGGLLGLMFSAWRFFKERGGRELLRKISQKLK